MPHDQDRLIQSAPLRLDWDRLSMTSLMNQRQLTTRVAQDATVTVTEEGKHLRFQLEAYILKERLAPERQVYTTFKRFPASPWQFFKQRHAASWWLRPLVRRRPVRMEAHSIYLEVRTERSLTYPESQFNPRLESLGRPVYVEQVSSSWRDF